MKARDIADLLLLGALWGGSFLFMRMAVPEFGAVPLAALRVVGAALLLVPLLSAGQGTATLRRHWKPIAWIGLCNSALPFMFFAYAALSIEAGVSAILNATAPLFGAFIAAVWLRESTDAWRTSGLLIGLAGVALLVWDRVGLKAGADPNVPTHAWSGPPLATVKSPVLVKALVDAGADVNWANGTTSVLAKHVLNCKMAGDEAYDNVAILLDAGATVTPEVRTLAQNLGDADPACAKVYGLISSR